MGSSTNPATPSRLIESAAPSGCSNSSMSPSSAATRPNSIRSSVVLPAPFGPEQTPDLALLDDEVDAVDRDRRLEPLDETPCTYGCHGRHYTATLFRYLRRVGPERGSAQPDQEVRSLPTAPPRVGGSDGRDQEVRQRLGGQPGRARRLLLVLLDLPAAAGVHDDPRLSYFRETRSCTTTSRPRYSPSSRSSATSCRRRR